jgi:hypothetical protein
VRIMLGRYSRLHLQNVAHYSHFGRSSMMQHREAAIKVIDEVAMVSRVTYRTLAIDKAERVLVLEAALREVLPFVERELECRESSYTPNPTEDEAQYIVEANKARKTILAALEAK